MSMFLAARRARLRRDRMRSRENDEEQNMEDTLVEGEPDDNRVHTSVIEIQSPQDCSDDSIIESNEDNKHPKDGKSKIQDLKDEIMGSLTRSVKTSNETNDQASETMDVMYENSERLQRINDTLFDVDTTVAKTEEDLSFIEAWGPRRWWRKITRGRNTKPERHKEVMPKNKRKKRERMENHHLRKERRDKQNNGDDNDSEEKEEEEKTDHSGDLSIHKLRRKLGRTKQGRLDDDRPTSNSSSKSRSRRSTRNLTKEEMLNQIGDNLDDLIAMTDEMTAELEEQGQMIETVRSNMENTQSHVVAAHRQAARIVRKK